jgi:hypothetical protein
LVDGYEVLIAAASVKFAFGEGELVQGVRDGKVNAVDLQQVGVQVQHLKSGFSFFRVLFVNKPFSYLTGLGCLLYQ